MQRPALVLGFTILAVGVTAGGLPAIAADDTWVSITGTDAGTCTIDAPCRTLNFALAQTSPGGSIVVLSSGRYGPLNITKSVNVMAEGVQAMVTGAAGCDAAVCINTGVGDTVSLHGLTVYVNNFPKNAILVSGGGTLSLERCVIQRNTSVGIAYGTSAEATLRVFDTIIATGSHAITLLPLEGSVQRVLIDGAHFHDSVHGLALAGFGAGAIHATVRNTVIDGVGAGTGTGILVDTGAGSVPMQLMLDRIVLANNGFGIEVRSGGNPTIRIGDSVIGGHKFVGIFASVGSYGTNKLADNSEEPPDGFPLPTIPLK